MRGAVGFGAEAAVSATFAEDLEFHGYTLEVSAQAVVELELTHQGSRMGLDTTLYVYGPRAAGGGYGVDQVAFDDDAGLEELATRYLPGCAKALVNEALDRSCVFGATSRWD